MINHTQLREVHIRAVYLGLILNLLLPAVVVIAGYAIRRAMYADEVPWASAPGTLTILFWVLLCVALSEIPVALLLRKLLLTANMCSMEKDDPQAAIMKVQSRYIVLYALALSPTFYGLVLYLLGGAMREFVLFAVVSLVIYRLVRPGQEFFYALFGVQLGGRTD